MTNNWNGAAFSKKLAAHNRKNLAAAAEFLRSQVVERISESTRANGPSKPGNPPHADTGKLMQTVFADVVSDERAIVGSPLDYAEYLEKGTAKMDARPFLEATLQDPDVAKIVERILTRPMKF